MSPEPDELPPHLADDEDDIDPGWPWSFLLLVGAGAIYLVLRFAQMFNDYILN